ncbi:hypothetical protein PC116_g30209 [Phytophthora cactorum]|nr:hypothetical protein PC116_g30209 [Phytophthora cactorum]
MFQQRNNLASGGDTPLHFWFKTANILSVYRVNNYGSSPMLLNDEDLQNIEVLRLLLEFSGGAELGILNGAGDTILHTAVLRHLAAHTKVLLEYDPNLAYRENAVGRTPGEIAYDLFINSKVGSQESLEPTQEHETIVNKMKRSIRNPRGYDLSRRTAAQDTRGKDRKENTWRILEEHLAKLDGKRRLVSLNEANDVAKRLGETYAWQRYYQKPTATDAERAEEEAQQRKLQPPQDDKLAGFVSTMYGNAKQRAWIEKDQATDFNASGPTTVFGSGIYQI